MTRSLLLLFLALLAAPLCAAEPDVDLTKVDRSIAALPKFQAQQQTYCLLVFGLQAKDRAWLVVDGKRLYVDRNGNGDLTDAGEQIILGDDFKDEGFREFSGGNLTPDGKRTHTDLALWMLSGTSGYLSLKVDGKLEQIAYPTLTDSPKTAPVVHLAGPLTFTSVSESIVRSSKPFDLQLMVGTPGLGEGTFAAVSHKCVPEPLQPKCEIEFVRVDGQQPIRQPLLLPGRC